MQKQREKTAKTEDQAEELPEAKKRDTSDIDALLDEIDEVLESSEQEEIERLSFKEKIKSLALRGRSSVNPCTDVTYVPAQLAEHYIARGAEVYDGPPCVDC